MSEKNKIFDAIDALGKDRGAQSAGKTKKITATLPVELIDTVNHYKDVLGYPSFSASLKAILTDYFNGLVEDKE